MCLFAMDVSPDIATAASPSLGGGESGSGPSADAEVTALYREHALGLGRLAYVMLGDKGAAEDAVQEAFIGLFRRWHHLSDPAKALSYLRASVLNQCRLALRKAARVPRHDVVMAIQVIATSAESAVLSTEQRREVAAATRRLPRRQREVLVLRFYLELTDAEIAQELGIALSTVRSTLHRGLSALGIALKEEPWA
jgi:RNA polymerase sigma-70 factor (sigma-E family)